MSDLGVSVAGSVLESRVAQLYRELAERGITFQPHVWLSEDWFMPDDVPGIAIPFFLAHPRAIAAFGRECTFRGVPPPTVNLFGSPFLTWRGRASRTG